MTRRQDGFTVIELMMAVTLSTLVVGAMATGILTYMRVAGGTADRLSETPQLQVAAVRFGADVQAASTVERTGAPPCSIPAGATWLGTFVSTDRGADVAVSDDAVVRVSYSHRLVATSAQRQLVVERSECRDSSAPQSTTSIVNSGNPAVPPTLNCTGTTCALALSVCTADAAGACKDDPITGTLTGSRRL